MTLFLMVTWLTTVLVALVNSACAPNPMTIFSDYTATLQRTATRPVVNLDCSSQQRGFLRKLPKGVTVISASQPVNMAMEGDALGTIGELTVSLGSPRWIAIACPDNERIAKIVVYIGPQ